MAARASRLLEARLVHGSTDPPPELHDWIIERFGSVESVREQAVVKVRNPWTLEATIFAPLRARRPIDNGTDGRDLRAELAETAGDPFCDPRTGTPADVFGRVRGARVLTGANAAIADAHHAVLVFEQHDPLAFDADLVRDVLATGREWAERAHADDPDAVNYLLVWNCLWRAGGSIVHGHAQALLGAGSHYEQVERFHRDAELYRAANAVEYIEDLIAVHRTLGLVIDLADGVSLLASLTPRKERELILIGEAGMEETDERFGTALGRTLEAYRNRAGVLAFNLAVWRAPIRRQPGWEGFPPIARIVDRGDPGSRASDIGAMELYGTPIVSADPYELIEQLR